MSTKTDTSSRSRNGSNVHSITGESGRAYKIRLLGIPTLLEFGHLPDHLVEVALADVVDTLTVPGDSDIPGFIVPGSVRYVAKADERQQKLERVLALAAYQRQLVASALVEPALDYEALTEKVREGEFPEEDLVMIAEIIQRIRDRDAKGVKLGVEPLERWATFREGHKGIACTGGEDCEGCLAVQQLFSSLDVGAL